MIVLSAEGVPAGMILFTSERNKYLSNALATGFSSSGKFSLHAPRKRVINSIYCNFIISLELYSGENNKKRFNSIDSWQFFRVFCIFVEDFE